MKRGIILIALILTALPLAYAAQTATTSCNPNVILVNQDPYPASPGDYVKLVFQVEGTTNPKCGVMSFTLLENYPFSLDPEVQNPRHITAGAFQQDFNTFWLLPYKVRVAEDAFGQENPIDIALSYEGSPSEIFTFDVEVEDQTTDFEISIKDYETATNTMTFEILNVGENDVDAVTIEIESQDSVQIKGSDRNILGSLDSNEDTSFTFEAIPKEGPIKMKIFYTDQANVRRSVEQEVVYNPDYFKGRAQDQGSSSWWFYLLLILVIVGFVYWRIRKRKKKRHAQHNQSHHLTKH